ncbi:MAG: LysR family transcriptional regulator [Bacillaceae bacterium]|nr:LysR family transcriptional regulator [Bacillaceae bacterium]
MNFNQLQSFVEVCKWMNVRKAAENLHVTQPAITAQLKQLEEELGVPLFVKKGRGIAITPEGEKLLDKARYILREVKEFKSMAEDLQEVPVGTLTAGTTTSIVLSILPRIIPYFHKENPRVRLSVHSLSRDRIIKKVLEGELDIGIIYMDQEVGGLQQETLFYDYFVLICSEGHPFYDKPFLSVRELDGQPLISLSSGTMGREYLDDVLRQHQVKPDYRLELNSSQEVLMMVELGVGAAVVAQSVVRGTYMSGFSREGRKIREIRIPELNKPHEARIIYRSDKYMSRALQAFIRDVKGIYGSEQWMGD